jgi:hypothetical protein
MEVANADVLRFLWNADVTRRSVFPKIFMQPYRIPLLRIPNRVARWYIFKTKIPIWINFVRPFDNLVAIWYIFSRFGKCIRKNLATLIPKARCHCFLFRQ